MPALYFGGDALLSLLGAPGLEPYLMLVPPVVFISGVFLALNYWNSRTKHFGRLSVTRVASSLATTGTQLGAGFAGHATGGSLFLHLGQDRTLVGTGPQKTKTNPTGGLWQAETRSLRQPQAEQ
ncbi:MAG: hypothetical protein PWR21_1285 [Methanoculleus sp.]|nr:hypothetical protein [Methanoculleus sp.]